MDVSKMKNLREIKENERGDYVVCNWCEWEGLIPFSSERCPNCGHGGALMFANDNEKEKFGLVFIPKKDC